MLPSISHAGKKLKHLSMLVKSPLQTSAIAAGKVHDRRGKRVPRGGRARVANLRSVIIRIGRAQLFRSPAKLSFVRLHRLSA